jgi:hypothetical protein
MGKHFGYVLPLISFGIFACSISAVGQVLDAALSLYTLAPCRVLDTRQSIGAFARQHTFPEDGRRLQSLRG